jgi:hypothetical protein
LPNGGKKQEAKNLIFLTLISRALTCEAPISGKQYSLTLIYERLTFEG